MPLPLFQAIGDMDGLECLEMTALTEDKGGGFDKGDLDLTPLCKLRRLQRLALVQVSCDCGLNKAFVVCTGSGRIYLSEIQEGMFGCVLAVQGHFFVIHFTSVTHTVRLLPSLLYS